MAAKKDINVMVLCFSVGIVEITDSIYTTTLEF